MSSRPKPVEKIRWTIAERINAGVWVVELAVTGFCVASAFAGIIATHTLPDYVFYPTALAAVVLAAFSFLLPGKLRQVFKTQKRADNEGSGYYRINMLYGDTTYFGKVDKPALKSSAAESTQRFKTEVEEYSHS